MGPLQQTPKTWNVDVGSFMLVFLVSFVLGLEDGHSPAFWLLEVLLTFEKDYHDQPSGPNEPQNWGGTPYAMTIPIRYKDQKALLRAVWSFRYQEAQRCCGRRA